MKHRRYGHCDIVLYFPIINQLKKWNKRNDVTDDDKFVKALLINVFSTNLLKRSTSLKDLDAGKIRFVRGITCSY